MSSRDLEGGGGSAHMVKLGRVELDWVELSGVVITEVELGGPFLQIAAFLYIAK